MPLLHIDLGPTFGAVSIGLDVSLFLTGILTLQTWNYFRMYPDDSIWLKSLVGFVCIADVVHTILLAAMVYHYDITSFGDFAALQHLISLWPASTAVECLIAFSVQSFYCLRVHRITNNKPLALFCWVIVTTRLGITEWLSATVFADLKSHSLIEISNSVRAPFIASVTLAAAADIIIAACICVGMLRMRSGIEVSDKVVDKIVAFTIGSGLLTSIVALTDMITYIVMDNLVFIAFVAVAAKVYANSLLASLIERSHLRAEMTLNGASLFAGSTHLTVQVPNISLTASHIETRAHLSAEDVEHAPRRPSHENIKVHL